MIINQIKLKYPLKHKVLYNKPSYFNNKTFKYLINTVKNQRGKINGKNLLNYFSKNMYFYNINYMFYNKNICNIYKYILIKIIYNLYNNKFIGLVLILNTYLKGLYMYIPLISGLKYGIILEEGNNVVDKIGNKKKLKFIKLGLIVSNISFNNVKESKYIRSSGSYGYIVGIKNNIILIKLPSNQIKKFTSDDFCIIGKNANIYNKFEIFGKAGFFRTKRSKVRGVAKNACDHPHGGGKSNSFLGKKTIYSKYGKKVFGKKK